MKKNIIIAVVAIAVAAAIFSYTGPLIMHKEPVSKDSLIKRGSYLVTIMGCNDCHTPMKMGPNGPESDTSRLLSGHPDYVPLSKFDTATTKSWVLFGMTGTSMVGPWGVTFSGNLTSDPSGIGNWTEEQFKTALRKGKLKGLENGREILPPMPWQNYMYVKDEDLSAIFAYLKSTRPVRNIVPAPISPDKFASYATNAK